ncbi:hypothetical protein NIE88_20595 [Sporolactobacillus shoreicorticis]|uniref:Integral membrane protein n=1 Tax=Sporolactobacillus shoreicorticis TaxID=1923877 RepID=A0ABW5S6V3_9BACL|nr:hypothetical protein [Sporolactobacillus shoreicorticis]MCO7128147.1 hypothetical protein [Sporolactobacillus shoreicorticis]
MGEETWMTIVLRIIGMTCVQFISLIGALIIGGFILGFLERQANGRMIHVFGMKGIYYTAWLGTPIHELSHAVMCLIFRHRVTEIKLLQAVDSDGTMGYVRHAYNPNSLYQRIGNLFIGVAPLIGGSLVIALCAKWVTDGASPALFDWSHARRLFSFFDLPSWEVLGKTILRIFQGLFTVSNYSHPVFWLFVLIALCVSSRMSLSSEDIRGAGSGAGALFGLLLVTNATSVLLDPALHTQITYWIGRFNFLLMVMLSLSVLFSLFVFLISHLLFLMVGRR